MKKILVLIAAAVALASCSSNKPVKTAPSELSVRKERKLLALFRNLRRNQSTFLQRLLGF